jgi:hypothetical protein
VDLELRTDVLQDVAEHRPGGCLVVDDDDVQGAVPSVRLLPVPRGPSHMLDAAPVPPQALAVPGLECVASVHGHVDILAVVAGMGKYRVVERLHGRGGRIVLRRNRQPQASINRRPPGACTGRVVHRGSKPNL